MKIKFRRTGGFAPIVIGCELDTEKLPADQAAEVERLIEATDVMKSESAVNKQVRDAQMYSIEIEDGTGKKSLTYDQTSVPVPLKPLIEYLRDHSKNILDEYEQ